jgi:hypothetical protein
MEWRAFATRWYQRRTCSKCRVELVSEQVHELDHGAGVAAVGRSPTPRSSLHAIGRSTSHGFLSYFSSFQAAAQNYLKIITLPTAAECALPRSLA